MRDDTDTRIYAQTHLVYAKFFQFSRLQLFYGCNKHCAHNCLPLSPTRYLCSVQFKSFICKWVYIRNSFKRYVCVCVIFSPLMLISVIQIDIFIADISAID